MISIAICDDEEYMLTDLKAKVLACMEAGGFQHRYTVRCFRSAKELLSAGERCDILFLDIQMEGLDGMEAAREIRKKDQETVILFVTVLREMVFDAFEVEASGYLVKPVEEEKLAEVLSRVLKNLSEKRQKYLTIQRGQSCLRLRHSEIYFCEVIKRKIYIHLGDEVVDYYDTLDRLEKRLTGDFFRCHRSYLVNLSHVRGFNHDCAVLENRDTVPVSRLRRQEFADAVLKYMKTGSGSVCRY